MTQFVILETVDKDTLEALAYGPGRPLAGAILAIGQETPHCVDCYDAGDCAGHDSRRGIHDRMRAARAALARSSEPREWVSAIANSAGIHCVITAPSATLAICGALADITSRGCDVCSVRVHCELSGEFAVAPVYPPDRYLPGELVGGTVDDVTRWYPPDRYLQSELAGSDEAVVYTAGDEE